MSAAQRARSRYLEAAAAAARPHLQGCRHGHEPGCASVSPARGPPGPHPHVLGLAGPAPVIDTGTDTDTDTDTDTGTDRCARGGQALLPVRLGGGVSFWPDRSVWPPAVNGQVRRRRTPGERGVALRRHSRRRRAPSGMREGKIRGRGGRRTPAVASARVAHGRARERSRPDGSAVHSRNVFPAGF